ncbi:UDP diphosphate synthase [Thermocladium modestius]|uniref:Tritrans,polycis-undecaprenyl-diphosphate synthase (geranylgeranyl-diphosphate specific) n=1 Tax=Thermocladium modestius TaxID=62609 RepID=A0A830GVH1_9CREN|nr:polyprenyl diphosphate synthase [Thermocladium modestius]GGP21586.1 UDP diphosphate synthase [Thermocladium modestius]
MNQGLSRFPLHIGVIPDGNRRWARKNNTDFFSAYRIGADKVEDFLDWAIEMGIKAVTVYVLSLENLMNRSETEKKIVYELLINKLIKTRSDPRIHNNRVRITAIGRWRNLPQRVVDEILNAMNSTSNYGDHFLNLAIAYGGLQSVVDMVNGMLGAKGEISDSELFKYLPTSFLPHPMIDLVIRTGGEYRLSNFFPLETAYAEMYFTNKYWPDFGRDDLIDALNFYAGRERRFGR